jgi:putative membrane-bound dehydrogenase-like protein
MPESFIEPATKFSINNYVRSILQLACRWLIGLTLVTSVMITVHAEEPMKLLTPINLLKSKDLSAFQPALNIKSSLTEQSQEAWKITAEGDLWQTGLGAGVLTTKSTFDDFHLVLEYSWGEHTWGQRGDLSRKSGLEIGHPDHAQASLTILMQEGKTGDIIRKKTYPRNTQLPWQNIRGMYHEQEPENPVGEWNRLEVIRHGAVIEVLLNGQTMNRLEDGFSGSVSLGLVSDMAELMVRRFELHPIHEFKEKWTAEVHSGNTGYSETGASILPRRAPWKIEKSQEAWHIDGKYQLQLVAAEPLVSDPVDVVWDDQGRMYVAEFRDYPLPPVHGARLSRIRLLTDHNHDGIMDSAVTWADDLENIQGMLSMNGGLLVTTMSGVLFLEDKNQDGIADARTRMFNVNLPRQNQLQISSPQWRLDNSIHFNNGLDGQKITTPGEQAHEFAYKGFNLRYNSFKDEFSAVPGLGQFGAGMDDYGHIFCCSNRNPVIHGVIPKHILERNRLVGAQSPQEDIQAPGAKIFPLELSHTTAMAHAGTFTAACGLCVYTGDLMPELKGNLFVCDPTAQLVTRNQLVPHGASFKAERIGDNKDFLVSSDEWCRPVNLRNGPDGALYICDMYRRFIDHSMFFPEDFTKTNYMRAGVDHGRIWRLVPADQPANVITARPTSTKELVTELAHPNSWQRTYAQRLLIEKKDLQSIPLLTSLLQHHSPLARLHAMWTLNGLFEQTGQGLTAEVALQLIHDPDAGVIENLIQLAQERKDIDLKPYTSELIRHPSAKVKFLTVMYHGESLEPQQLADYLQTEGWDHWARYAVMSISSTSSGDVLAEVISRSGKSFPREVYLELAETMAAKGDPAQLAEVISNIENHTEQRAIIIGLSKGLPRSLFKSLHALINNPPAELQGKLDLLQQVLAQAKEKLLDRHAELQVRLDSLFLVQNDIFPLLDELLQLDQPPELQTALCRSLSRYDRIKVADYFFSHWDTLGPVPRKEGLTLIIANKSTLVKLLHKMKAGEISRSLLPLMDRWVLSRSPDTEIKGMINELYGESQSDRSKVIKEYITGFKTGDVDRGRTVFEKANCIVCHSPQKDGRQIGPNIADVRIKPFEAIITDILDPNRVVEERWTSYTVVTEDGLTHSGLILSETATALEFVQGNGERLIIKRSEILSLTSPGISLMPEGFEKQINPAQMADLIAYLKSARVMELNSIKKP